MGGSALQWYDQNQTPINLFWKLGVGGEGEGGFQLEFPILNFKTILSFSCEDAAQQVLMSVCLSVCLSVVNMKFYLYPDQIRSNSKGGEENFY